MKDLEVKTMLADKDIPDDYKLGGRLDSRFLDGVEYAERKLLESGRQMWLAMDEDDDKNIYLFGDKPVLDEGVWDGIILLTLDPRHLPDSFGEVTFKNSPRSVRLVMEE